MIIFGTRGVTGTLAQGQFHCPRCNSQRNYNHKRVRRFFTLYFIPLIPMGELGQYVECPGCQGTYDVDILNYDPSAEGKKIEAYFFVAVKQVMIAMLLADGHIDDDEVKMLQKVFRDLTESEIPEEELREEITVIQASGSTALSFVEEVAPQLNDKGRETVIRAAYAIAASDGNVDESEMAFLHEVGAALELTAAHLKGLIAECVTEGRIGSSVS